MISRVHRNEMSEDVKGRMEKGKSAPSSGPPTAAASGTAATPTAAPSTPSHTPTTSPASVAATPPSLLGPGRVIDEQRVEGQRVWEDEVPDVVAADTQGVQLLGVAVLHRHLYRLQMSVHTDINTCDCPVNLSAIFQLNCHCFMTQLHKKSDKLHDGTDLKSQQPAQRRSAKNERRFFDQML